MRHKLLLQSPIFAVISISLAALHSDAQSSISAESHLSARDVFYNVFDDANSSPTQPAAKKPKSKTVKAVPGRASAPIGSSADNSPGNQLASAKAAPSSPPDGSVALTTKVSDPVFPPLGLKYSILSLSEPGSSSGVDPDVIFHSKDRIQLKIEVNSPGYLYVIARGASGKWSTLFPQSATDYHASYITPGQKYSVPGRPIVFTDPTGQEEMFLYLSRQPVLNAEDLMLQLSRGNDKPAAGAPVTGGNAHQAMPTVEAWNRIDDAGVAALKQLYSRDLMVETAPSAAPQASADQQNEPEGKSVYVVERSGKSDAHVVADIVLKHE